MKYLYLILIVVLIMACSPSEKKITEELKTEFIKTTNTFNNLYITAGDCEERNSMIDENIVFFENRKPFTYENIVEYCSYITPKNVFDVYTKRHLINVTAGFDYVDHYFINSEQDTVREISSRIWELKSNKWVVTHMEVSRN